MRIELLLLLLLILPVQSVMAHGSSSEPEQTGLTLPQILGLTVIGAVILLICLYFLGITDKIFLLRTLLIAGILLALDFILARTYL